MPGREKKPAAQIEYERALRSRLEELRKARFPGGAMEGRRKLVERVGISYERFEKWEQRGAISAWGIALLCEKLNADPYELLGIQRPPDDLSRIAKWVGEICDHLPEKQQSDLLAYIFYLARTNLPKKAESAPPHPALTGEKEDAEAYEAAEQ